MHTIYTNTLMAQQQLLLPSLYSIHASSSGIQQAIKNIELTTLDQLEATIMDTLLATKPASRNVNYREL
jgi:hypothetical protein